jgi:hypothetical protein
MLKRRFKWIMLEDRLSAWARRTPKQAALLLRTGCEVLLKRRVRPASDAQNRRPFQLRLASWPRLSVLLGGPRLERQAKTQGHTLDRIGRAPELFRRLFQRRRRLGQLHEPAVFLERPGLLRHNRNDPLASTKTKPPSGPMSLDGFAWVGPGLWGKPGAEMDMRSVRLRNKQRGLS